MTGPGPAWTGTRLTSWRPTSPGPLVSGRADRRGQAAGLAAGPRH
jgi:hypothetical protein